MKNDHNILNTMTTRTSTSVRRLSAPAATRRSIVTPKSQRRLGGRGPWGQGRSVAIAIALGWLALASQASAQVETVPPASAPSKNPAAAADQKANKPKTAKVSKDAAKATAHTGVTAAQAAAPTPIAMPDAAPAPTPAADAAPAPATGNGTPNSALLDPLQAPLTGQPLPPLNLQAPVDPTAPAPPPVSPEQAQANAITSALEKEKADYEAKSAQFEQVKNAPADKLAETLATLKLEDDAMRQQQTDLATATTALDNLKKQNLPETDPQIVAANEQVKKVTGLLQQAAESRREALGIDVDVLKVKIANHEKELAALQAKTGQPGANGAAAAADDKTPVGDIRDIRPPVLIPDAWMWVIYTAVSLLAAAIAGTVGYFLWKKYRTRKIVLLPHELALKRLDKARELMTPETAREYTFAVSEAARQYIESRFEAKAAHRTTEEFLRDLIDTRNQTSPLTGYSSLLEEFLNHCDLVKFARWSLTTPEMERMHESARKFVLETMPMAARAHRNGAATKHDPPVAPPSAPVAPAAESTRVGAP